MPSRLRTPLILVALLACAGLARADADPSPRVRALIAQMTREEKLAVIRGAQEPEATFQGQAGWIAGVPRLGIPDLRLADGPPGVLVRHASTGMPATMAMAATFSRADAAANGAVIGRDARALGVDVILQPYINLDRDPAYERAYNTLGEDPLLTGELAAAFVKAAQAQGVMAQAKHFVAYDGGVDAVLGEQALHEVYLAPFKAVVDAGVASLMCAYSHVNGVYSCGNEGLLTHVLRDEFGFAGFVTSDWGAAHGAEFLARGMDMEQPGGGPDAFFALHDKPADAKGMSAEEVDALVKIMSVGVPEEQRFAPTAKAEDKTPPLADVSANLGRALARGSVGDADIDRAVARVLGQIERFGWLDHAPSHRVGPENVAADAAVVQRTAERAAVLLKNDGILPLRRAELPRVALIGPGAQQAFAIVTGAEQSYGRPERQTGALAALRAMSPGRGPRFAVADDMSGVAIPASSWHDLKRVGDGAAVAAIDFTRRAGRALPAGTSASWTGTLEVPAEGDYDLDLQLLGATGKLFVDGQPIGAMAWWGGHGEIVFANRDNVVPTLDGLDNLRRLVPLRAGPHEVRVEATADVSGAPVQVRLAWVTPAMKRETFDAAVAAARAAKTAVVFAWGRNRPAFGLPGEQDRLIEAVAAVNPNTVVVLNTSQAVALPWLAKVRAVLELWYTGDEGGRATARLLTGEVSPAGRLPFTWPQRLEDGAANDPAYPERQSVGVAGRTHYDEGVDIGYRWFDRMDRAPLFPFGHGLSYTRFDYADLAVAPAADGGADLAFTLRNAGARASDEVVQVYLGAPAQAPAGAAFAVRALAAFERVALRAGESRRVHLHIAAAQLRYWSVADHGWRPAPLERQVYVGASSRDLRLSGALAAAR
ncbi:MAG: glycoside hydrolase family 3 C-terminal domain-containing protein [Pelomonas sp.]|nr:glycoside hydrolase family 3 C-terminal domain-containing protein [Roseateles sp.]